MNTELNSLKDEELLESFKEIEKSYKHRVRYYMKTQKYTTVIAALTMFTLIFMFLVA